MRRRLLERPLPIVVLDCHWSLLVQTDAPSVQDSGGQNSVRNRRQTLAVEVRGLRLPRIDAPCSVNELFDGHVAVPALSIEVTALGRRVFHTGNGFSRWRARQGNAHVLEGVVPGLPSLILDNVVAAVCLIDVDFSLWV